MFIDVTKIPPEGQELDSALESAELLFADEEFRLIAPVELRGRIQPVEPAKNDAFHLHGALVATVEVDCVRCLEPTPVDVREQLDLVYVPQAQNVDREGADEKGLQADELSVSFYSEDQIDLRHMIREQLLLALPMKPLCRDDCQGLCPECGSNRNETPCDCEPESLDPRLADLKGLLD